jgi:hypothetical protein
MRHQRAEYTSRDVSVSRSGRKWYLWSSFGVYFIQFNAFNWPNAIRDSTMIQSYYHYLMWLSQKCHPTPLGILWRFVKTPNYTCREKSLMIWCWGRESPGTAAWFRVWIGSERLSGLGRRLRLITKIRQGYQRLDIRRRFLAFSRLV